MRHTRVILNSRCYHPISRLAHQAFFLDDDERMRAVELLRRVEALGVWSRLRGRGGPVAGEWRYRANRSRSSAVAPAEVLPGMSYYITDTISISSDPYVSSVLKEGI